MRSSDLLLSRTSSRTISRTSTWTNSPEAAMYCEQLQDLALAEPQTATVLECGHLPGLGPVNDRSGLEAEQFAQFVCRKQPLRHQGLPSEHEPCNRPIGWFSLGSRVSSISPYSESSRLRDGRRTSA